MRVNNDNSSAGKSQVSLATGTQTVCFGPRDIWRTQLCSENIGHLKNAWHNFKEDSKVENQKLRDCPFERDKSIENLKYTKYKPRKTDCFQETTD